jgi:hypothetical protein
VQEPQGEPIEMSDFGDFSFAATLEGAGVEQVEQSLSAGLIQSVDGADNALQSLRKSFAQATSQERRNEIQALITRVKKLRQGFRNTGTETTRLQRLGERAQGILRKGFLQLGGAVGSAIGGLLDGKNAFRSLAQAGKQAIQQLISQLTSLAIKAAVIAPLIGALGLGTGGGGFGLPMGGFIPGLDSGGMILSDGIAKVHKGEAVVNREMMRSGMMPGGPPSRRRSTRLEGGDVVIPGSLIDQARENGSRDRARTGRRV